MIDDLHESTQLKVYLCVVEIYLKIKPNLGIGRLEYYSKKTIIL